MDRKLSSFQDYGIYFDRYEAGKVLANKLLPYKKEHPLILALPRGGVPVGYEVAKKLETDLDLIIVRKIGAPFNPEFGIGAITEDGVLFLDKETIYALNIPEKVFMDIVRNEEEEATRRHLVYHNNYQVISLRGRTVILVDDGLATGVTAHAALKSIWAKDPKKIIFASPICASGTINLLTEKTYAVVCAETRHDLQAIGLYYKNFKQVTDEEVIQLLHKKI